MRFNKLFILVVFIYWQPKPACAQFWKAKSCYLKVDFKLEGQQIFTDRISCFTKETGFTDEHKTELNLGDYMTDSNIVFTRYFMLGKKRKLKNYQSVNVIIQLIGKNKDVIQSIDGEILKADWECR